jgi:hypothetical protein
MPKVVEGTFRGGKIEFAQTPPGREGERVLVTFLSQDLSQAKSRIIAYGEFRRAEPQGQWGDFVDAKRALYKDIDGDCNADASRR